MDAKLFESIHFWRSSARSGLETAEILFKNKKYDSCLFFCHLAIEKILKGLIVAKKEQAAPYIHDLVELADQTGLVISERKRKDLSTISTFNIAARYDSVKIKFYKKCTVIYASKYMKISKEIYLWFEKQYPKK